MTATLSMAQLTGCDDSHLVRLPCGNRLQQQVAQAFTGLQADARAAGFELAVASSFRSFSRQLAIWNGKACGERAVHDDAGCPVDVAALDAQEQLSAILRFSALPGASRHHWGTDLDVFDAARLPQGYQLQLSPQEVAPGGLFDDLHCWLDERVAKDEAHGFYRPYASDRGGVAPERWHLSFAPLSRGCAQQLNADVLRETWEGSEEVLLLRSQVERELPQILARYVFAANEVVSQIA